jgi:thiamine-monophosphate kinase
MPLSEPYIAVLGGDVEARLRAAAAGDDYELLFAAAPDRSPGIRALSDRLGLPLSCIGTVEEGEGLSLTCAGEPLPLPARLGWEHG